MGILYRPPRYMPKPRKDEDKQACKPIGLEANDWARSERFMQDIAKADLQPRVAKLKTRPVSKGLVHKGKTRA
jgi:hypothetical protein